MVTRLMLYTTRHPSNCPEEHLYGQTIDAFTPRAILAIAQRNICMVRRLNYAGPLRGARSTELPRLAPSLAVNKRPQNKY